MSDFDFPADLLELQRAYNAADARCVEIGNALPGARAIIEGADVDFTELGQARAERLDLAVQLQQHPWWETLDKSNRVNGRLALRKAAQDPAA